MTGVDNMLVAREIAEASAEWGAKIKNDRGALYLNKANTQKLLETWDKDSDAVYYFQDLETRASMQIWISYPLMESLAKQFQS